MHYVFDRHKILLHHVGDNSDDHRIHKKSAFKLEKIVTMHSSTIQVFKQISEEFESH